MTEDQRLRLRRGNHNPFTLYLDPPATDGGAPEDRKVEDALTNFVGSVRTPELAEAIVAAVNREDCEFPGEKDLVRAYNDTCHDVYLGGKPLLERFRILQDAVRHVLALEAKRGGGFPL